MNKRKPQIQTIRNRRRTLRTPSIRTHDNTLCQVDILADPAQRAGLRVQIVDGHVEEALDLARVQIHGDDVVAAGRLQHVGGEFGSDGRARLVLFVLARVGEVGDDGRDAPRRGGFAGVDHDHELHEAVVDVARGGALEDEDWVGMVSCLSLWGLSIFSRGYDASGLLLDSLELAVSRNPLSIQLKHAKSPLTIFITDRLPYRQRRLLVGILRH